MFSSEYWHLRAEEIRTKADAMVTMECRAAMMNVALRCDEMSARAADREEKEKLSGKLVVTYP